MSRTGRQALVLVAALGLGASAAWAGGGCGSSSQGSTFEDAGPGGEDGTTGPDVGFVGPPGTDGPSGSFSDFPSTPVLDTPDGGPGAPANSPSLFGPPSQGAQSGGPCLVEPEVGALYPNNWLRPRFRWLAAGGENLFELRVHAQNQVNDLVVYTSSTSWTMPKALWDALRTDSPDVPMTVTVRGGVLGGTALTGEAVGSQGAIGIAPVDAPGTIVYWTTTGGSALKGFSIGDETVGAVLVPGQIQEYSASCLGCHTSTPDGNFAAFSTSANNWSDGLASIAADGGTIGAFPPWLGAGGKSVLEGSYRGIETFSQAHWTTGDRVEITGDNPSNNGTGNLIWIDLEATTATNASGTIARTGDSNGAGAPSWSHDGTTVAYVSTNTLTDGRLGGNFQSDTDPGALADIYTVPYNARAGGAASAVAGASDPNWLEYYPAFSPDDQWLAFDRAPLGYNMYNQSRAELFVIPRAGGTATRLGANDPPACTGKKSPGVTNSWPKWSPSVGTASGARTFYWLVFSSTRDENGNPQLYVTAVVVDGSGKVTTYASLYLWNQPAVENNHTPAWDVFNIPPPPPPR